MSQLNLKKLRAGINRRKLINNLFAILGIIVIAFATLILLALTLKMALQGVERISPEFFTSFPSRRAERAGILSLLG